MPFLSLLLLSDGTCRVILPRTGHSRDSLMRQCVQIVANETGRNIRCSPRTLSSSSSSKIAPSKRDVNLSRDEEDGRGTDLTLWSTDNDRLFPSRRRRHLFVRDTFLSATENTRSLTIKMSRTW
ncbi:hypothetical protein PUN28_004538 [Cardiocondyla obscurior]|uniref:Secreted protein n=1 Tax=Cardiocondyla obscurior TaxID=286306 RepID=A0AAW2GBC0_9HYME